MDETSSRPDDLTTWDDDGAASCRWCDLAAPPQPAAAAIDSGMPARGLVSPLAGNPYEIVKKPSFRGSDWDLQKLQSSSLSNSRS
ncbi:hypothetical protein [Rubinisphaera margarita]|uniref:hypothetical protein n=1 Tax=Rubinisphaera margarita TaxID=2909586 RepID=UPI001EE830FC|nr:hypothetical protein [Rubinisphaera margarita]MCG6155531.1 hypothetical protein [Rubinisphaera margarita]